MTFGDRLSNLISFVLVSNNLWNDLNVPLFFVSLKLIAFKNNVMNLIYK